MPGVTTHILLLRRIAQAAPQELRDIFASHPNHAAWGSIGPDAFYFHPADWGPLGTFFSFIYDVQDTLRDLIGLYDEINDALEDIDNFLTGGLYLEIKRTTESLMITVKAILFRALSDQVDLFKVIRPPLSVGDPVTKWWWVDILHHHRASAFASRLWHNAGRDTSVKAYCLGYVSHIAGDVVAHPYVNVVSGGPFRLHGRRHVFVEKCFDTYLMDKWLGLPLSNCQLHKDIRFGDESAPPKLPDSLCAVIAQSLREVYADLGIESGVPKEKDIHTGYFFFYKFMEATTSMAGINLPAPPDFDFFHLPDEIKNLIKPPPRINVPPGMPDSLDDWRNLLASLIAFIEWAIETVIAITAVAYSVFAQLTTAALRFVLWLIQRLIYEIYDKIRLSLAISAHLHPETHHLRYFERIIHPAYRPLLEYKYPFESPPFTPDQTYHLIHPSQMRLGTEGPTCRPASVYTGGLSGINGDAFYDVESPLVGDSPSPSGDPLLEVCSAADSDEVERLINARRHYRSAKSLCLKLYESLLTSGGTDMPNWNLDADRGYAWPSWKWLRGKPWHGPTDFALYCNE